jgi:SMC interacting uncharacterized protein involved in chromosome segregation
MVSGAEPSGAKPLDVRRILETIREVEEWTQRKEALEAHLRELPRPQRVALRAELEIVRQQLQHYQALMEDMKRSVSRPSIPSFFESV